MMAIEKDMDQRAGPSIPLCEILGDPVAFRSMAGIISSNRDKGSFTFITVRILRCYRFLTDGVMLRLSDGLLRLPDGC